MSGMRRVAVGVTAALCVPLGACTPYAESPPAEISPYATSTPEVTQPELLPTESPFDVTSREGF